MVNFRDAAGWHWADQGVPAGSFAVFDPSVITYADNLGYRRIYAFAEGSNEHLVVNYWNGAAWFWADQGLPSGATAVFESGACALMRPCWV